jgi:mono/diheme cytochrome c family protein
VQGAGHCGSCHSARNILFIERGYSSSDSKFLTGNVLDNWYAPNLRGDVSAGLGSWSEDNIVAFLKTGHGHGGASFGAMNQVVEDSAQHMTDDDLHSIAAYLKTLSAEQSVPRKTEPPDFQAYPIEHPGAGLYGGLCARCHGDKGQGRDPDYPMLAGNPAITAKNPASLIHLVLEGSASARTDTGPKPKTMPPFARLTDAEIGEVLSYIRQAWGNNAETVSTKQVTNLRAKIKQSNAAKSKK